MLLQDDTRDAASKRLPFRWGPFMLSDVVGRVRNTKLAPSHGLMPLFEAVVNAVQAIAETRRNDGSVRVQILREQSLLPDEAHGNMLAPIRGFRIVDNGCGFTDANFLSFNTLDSQAKTEIGGKGIGRILWLKAFESARVTSEFIGHDGPQRRAFQFVLTREAIVDHALTGLSASENWQPNTEVTLIGWQPRFRDAAPKSVEAIGRRIVEHCLEYYLLEQMPSVEVCDEGASECVALSTIYREDYAPQSSSRCYRVGTFAFELTDVLIRTSEPVHCICFCANGRVVESVNLQSRLPHLDRPFEDEHGRPLAYRALVRGEALDGAVDQERTTFNFSRDGELRVYGELTWSEVVDGALEAVSEFLGPRTEQRRQEALRRVSDFISVKEPRYRPLLNDCVSELAELPSSLSDVRLELELHRLLNEWRLQIKTRAAQNLQDLSEEPSSFEEHKEAFMRVVGEMAEVAKSDLADYVVHRGAVLSFFEKLLGRDETGSFSREDALHGLFFPQRSTSDVVEFDKHNLWMLDERLAYHRFLASDIPFVNQRGAPVQVADQDRPDLLIYGNPLAFVPGAESFGSVVVVEFKRPERAQYRDEDSPIRQVLRYVGKIRGGQAQRLDGASLDRVPDHIPFYCHIVATLTDRVRQDALEAGLIEAPDRQGFFGYNPNYRAYIEVSSYRKVLADARMRNRAFFDRLQLPGNLRPD